MNFATTKERIVYFIDKQGFSVKDFLSKTEIKRGFLDSDKLKATVSDVFIAKIIANYPELNLEWLLTGNGEMLKEDVSAIKEEQAPYYINPKGIPLVNVTAIGGFGNSKFAIEQKDVKSYYVIPKFQHKKIDFMIEVEGSSMYPKYNSGDVVACKIINEQSFIQWNKTHVIATKDQGIIIKRIKKGENGSLLMVSDNKDYDPFPVPTEEIEGIALVVGVIRLE